MIGKDLKKLGIPKTPKRVSAPEPGPYRVSWTIMGTKPGKMYVHKGSTLIIPTTPRG